MVFGVVPGLSRILDRSHPDPELFYKTLPPIVGSYLCYNALNRILKMELRREAIDTLSKKTMQNLAGNFDLKG